MVRRHLLSLQVGPPCSTLFTDRQPPLPHLCSYRPPAPPARMCHTDEPLLPLLHVVAIVGPLPLSTIPLFCSVRPHLPLLRVATIAGPLLLSIIALFCSVQNHHQCTPSSPPVFIHAGLLSIPPAPYHNDDPILKLSGARAPPALPNFGPSSPFSLHGERHEHNSSRQVKTPLTFPSSARTCKSFLGHLRP
jgi:hypothetical protein